MSGDLRYRRNLLSALIGVLALLGCFQNCAGPGTGAITGPCESLPAVPKWFQFHDRETNKRLTINTEARTTHLAHFDENSADQTSCDANGTLSEEDAAFFEERLALLKYTEAAQPDVVAMYLHGATLDFIVADDIIDGIWIKRGDATGTFKLACTDTTQLMQKLQTIAAQLEAAGCN